jgi:hypothetical protein
MISGAVKMYLLLGVCLIAIVLTIAVFTHTTTDAVEIEAIKNPGPKKVAIETAGVHNTNTLVEGDISLDLHGSTIAALILGTVILVGTVSLSSVKIISWRRRNSANGRQQPPPAATFAPNIPPVPMPRPSAPYQEPPRPRPSAPYQDPQPSAPYPDAQEPSPGDPAALSALEIAVAKMIARDKVNSFHSALSPGTTP